MLDAAGDTSLWDFIVIGGGATGLGVAVDAAARGFRTLLLERGDFANATSSRSTKLIHGGVRYLKQGNFKLVREALHERALLLRHAPHLVHRRSFIIPTYSWAEAAFYGIGLKVYDAMSGPSRGDSSRQLSRADTIELLPTLDPVRLRGGTIYADAQFDDARLAIVLAQTAADLGAIVINYISVTEFVREGARICAVVARDEETGIEYRFKGRAFVNATGVFTDAIRRMDNPTSPALISPSQGAHIVVPRSFLPGEAALMVPRTDDKRVLFAIPWQERVVVGTTDTPLSKVEPAPRPLGSEVDFLLEHIARYLRKPPGRGDILSTFAGLRPLVRPAHARGTALIPRDHVITVSETGLVTITGGKWTTYRKMAADAVNRALTVAHLAPRPSRTSEFPLHGAADLTTGPLASYGSDAPRILSLAQEKPEWGQALDTVLPYIGAEVIWAASHEMARTVEDVLARRTRAIFLDARASMRAARGVAALLAESLGRDASWVEQQTEAYLRLASDYLPTQ